MVNWRASVALAMLVVVSFSGCDEKSTAPTPQKFPFNIDWLPGGDYAGFYVADEAGLCSKQGLDLEITPGNGAEDAVKLIASGRVKIGTTTADAILNYARESSPGKTIDLSGVPRVAAVVFSRNPVVIVSRDPIGEIADLAGKRLGFSEEGSVTYRQFKSLWKTKMGQDLPTPINPDQSRDATGDFRLVRVGYDGARYLRSGAVDAVLAYATDVPVELATDKPPYNVKYLSDFGVNVAGMVIAIAPGIPNSEINQEELGDFLECTMAGWERTRADPASAARLIHGRFPELDEAKLVESISISVGLLPKVSGGASYSSYLARGEIRSALQESDEVVSSERPTPDERPLDVDKLIWSAD